MSIYWFMFSIPLMFSIFPIKLRSSTNDKALFAYAFTCVLFIGFKYEVGGDWIIYLLQADLAYYTSFFDFILPGADISDDLIKRTNIEIQGSSYNPGFLFVLWISQHLGLNVLGVNLVCAAIFMLGLHKLCKNQPYPWLAYVVAFPYLILVVGMGYTRQACAIGIAFWCFTIWQKNEKYTIIKILFLILIGFTFHKSILILIFLFIIPRKGPLIPFKYILASKLSWLYIILSIPIIIITMIYFYKLVGSNTLTWYLANTSVFDKSNTGAIISSGAVSRAFLNIPACILFFYFYKNFKIYEDRRIWVAISLISIVLLFFAPFFTTITDRIGLFFIALQVVVYSRVPEFINNSYARIAYVYAVIFLYFSLFITWLYFSYSSHAWIPYKINILKPSILLE